MEAENKIISKKELLAKYGISYGSLYRWKRKGLIPDEWFIRKATVTGQETFFPENLICERMERIMATKEDVLLDELAAAFSGEEKNDQSIMVETAYGKHVYKVSDIRKITFTSGDRKTDLTKQIMGIVKEDKT